MILDADTQEGNAKMFLCKKCEMPEGFSCENCTIGRLIIDNASKARPTATNLKAEWPSLFKCSACGWDDGDTFTGDTDTYNYCPNCGAKLVDE